MLNRMTLAVAITAVSLMATSVPTNARQPEHQDRRHKVSKEQHKAQKQQQQRHHKEQKAEQQQQRQQRHEVRLSEKQQQQLIHKQRERLAQYRRHLEQQQRVVHQRSARLQQAKRVAQYRFQQQYLERLRQQQIRIANERHDYGNDPYYYTPPSHRYLRAGNYYETNEYGANLLRSAVNNGYEEGFRAGEADREDRWASNYRDSFVYDDANYGYNGHYVERADYNHYFREGFRRGYEDGYGSRHQYGSSSDGKNSILGTVLASILNFQSLRQ